MRIAALIIAGAVGMAIGRPMGGAIGAAQPSMAAEPQAAPAAASDWHVTVRDFAAKHFKNPAWG
jgi:membrane-bound ClpP family serine protease